MPDDLDMMQLASSGQLLATEDATQYLGVHVVLAWTNDGVPTLYCAYKDWAAMPIARLAAKDRELAELAELAEQRAQQVLDLRQQVAALQHQLANREPPTDAPPPKQPYQSGGAKQRIACEACGKRIWPDLMAKHMAEKHPPAPAAPIQLVSDEGWHCAAKGCSGAYTRSLLEPAFCTYHAKPQLNGSTPADLEVAHGR